LRALPEFLIGYHTERMILLRDLEFAGYICENNFIGILKTMSNAKNFDILARIISGVQN